MSVNPQSPESHSLAYMFMIVMLGGLIMAWLYALFQAPLFEIWGTTLYSTSNADAQNALDWIKLEFQWFPFLFVFAAMFAVFVTARRSNP